MMLRALGVYWALGLLLLVARSMFGPGVLVGGVIAITALLAVFVGFAAYFFRDPDARVPEGPGLVVAPAHGTVDVIDDRHGHSILAYSTQCTPNVLALVTAGASGQALRNAKQILEGAR